MDWPVPKNVSELVSADPDRVWETDAFDPVRLSVQGGTTYDGRVIDLAWQIEFEPEAVAGSVGAALIDSLSGDADGDAWTAIIFDTVVARHPDLKNELRSDSELATCVIWVETESACRRVLEVVQELVREEDDD
jgi:sugar lactone lactonase YvrE